MQNPSNLSEDGILVLVKRAKKGLIKTIAKGQRIKAYNILFSREESEVFYSIYFSEKRFRDTTNHCKKVSILTLR
jgi:hypothetical protein